MGGIVSGIGALLGGAPNNANFTASTGNAATTQAQQQAQSGIAQQQALANALQAQNGIGNQSSVFNQLQGVANGTGPNPAQAALNQNTGANVANQAALMAGQRGAGANVGLETRQAAQQGAQTQQQAVGQGATMQANQSLNALGQLGGIAGQQVAQQQGAVTGLNQATQSNQGQLLQQVQGQNTVNAGVANNNANNSANALGGLLGGISGIGSLLGGGGAAAASPGTAAGFGSLTTASNPAAAVGDYASLAGGGQVENPKLARVPSSDRLSNQLYPSHLKEMGDLYHGNSFKTPSFAYGGDVGNSLKQGGNVPGEAKMKGDHESNDTVKAKLSPGEVVIPKSIMESDDPASGAAKFVAALQKKKGMVKGGMANGGETGNEMGDFKGALQRAIAGRKTK